MTIRISDDLDEADEKQDRKPLNGSLADQAVSSRDLFLRKTRRVETHRINFDGQEIEIRVCGLDTREFNKLVSNHLPRRGNSVDQARGFNADTFPPALLAGSIIEPKLSPDEWGDIFASPEWSLGEVAALVDLAWSASNRGFDVPFGGNGSG